MSSSAAEKLVKELARKPSNTVCANCGTTKKFGFSTVCIKYYTFVCNNCKSSHQAISHRCKSLTMSSWTDQEVAELKRKGNDHARRTWLKNAPPIGQGGRPKEGDSVDVFKRFVVEAYERKKYYGEDDGAAPLPLAAPAAAPRPSRATRAPVRRAVPPPAPAPAAPIADLLDFSAASSAPASSTFQANFDAFAPTTPSVSSSGPSVGATSGATTIQNDPFATKATPASNASSFNFINNSKSTTTTTVPPKVPAIKKPVMNTIGAPAASNASSTNSNAFEANFDAFAPSSASKPFTSAATVPNDPFQPSATQTTPASNGSSFNFINTGSTTPSAATPAPAVPAVKKPVMNNSSMSQKSSLISSMNIPTGPTNNQQGRQNNMGMGMGWNNNTMANNPNAFGGMGNMNQTMMMQQQQMNMMNGMMNGMNLNNNGMGMGMMGNNNMMMGNSNPMMMNMMGNNNSNMMMMTNQQSAMMNGNNFGNQKGNKSNNIGSMQSLQMNMSSMNAWSSGK